MSNAVRKFSRTQAASNLYGVWMAAVCVAAYYFDLGWIAWAGLVLAPPGALVFYEDYVDPEFPPAYVTAPVAWWSRSEAKRRIRDRREERREEK